MSSLLFMANLVMAVIVLSVFASNGNRLALVVGIFNLFSCLLLK